MPIEASLNRGRLRMEALMLDTVTISEDVQGTADDTFDRTTLTWSRPSGDDVEVYSGSCSIRFETAAPGAEGGEQVTFGRWVVRLPMAVPVKGEGVAVGLAEGQVIRCSASGRDSSLVGRKWKVDQVPGGTFIVSRRLYCTEIRTDPRMAPDEGVTA